MSNMAKLCQVSSEQEECVRSKANLKQSSNGMRLSLGSPSSIHSSGPLSMPQGLQQSIVRLATRKLLAIVS